MSIFSRIFRKKNQDNDTGRVSSIERYERSVATPIEFRTRNGGSKPLDFKMDNETIREMKEKPVRAFEQAIQAGIIDETFDLENSIFVHMLCELQKKAERNLLLQKIDREDVGNTIKEQAFEDYLIEIRKQNMLNGERRSIPGIQEYEKVEADEKERNR